MSDVVEIYENGVLVGTEPAPPRPAHAVNLDALHAQAATALDVNRAFLARDTPTNPQTLAQVNALTRQVNALIRLTLGQLDGTD